MQQKTNFDCENYIHDFYFRAKLRVSVNLGSYPWTNELDDNSVIAGSLLDDDQWHDVSIIRTEKDLNITVDGVRMWRNLTASFLHMDMNRKVIRKFAAFSLKIVECLA